MKISLPALMLAMLATLAAASSPLRSPPGMLKRPPGGGPSRVARRRPDWVDQASDCFCSVDNAYMCRKGGSNRHSNDGERKHDGSPKHPAKGPGNPTAAPDYIDFPLGMDRRAAPPRRGPGAVGRRAAAPSGGDAEGVGARAASPEDQYEVVSYGCRGLL